MSTGGGPEIGYAEREEVVQALSRHHTDGRLPTDEFDDRVRRARAATSAGELAALVTDLPGPHPEIASPEASGASPDPASAPGPAGDPAGGSAPSGAPDPDATGRFPAPDPTRQYPAGPVPDGSGHPAAGPLPDGAPTLAAPAQQGYTPYPGGAGHPPPYETADRPGSPWEPGTPHPTGDRYPGGEPYGYPPAWAHPPEYGASYPGGPGGPSYPPHPGPPAYGPYGGYDPSAPFGREVYSGRPYSDKQKIVAGLLQVFLPFGIGRFYTGHTGMAIAQLLVTFLTFGLGGIWSFIDGVVILAGNPLDPHGRPLRP